MTFRLALALLLIVASTTVPAHEIPNEVTIQTFLKPEGRQLNFLVRAPLKAMRDMDVPRRAGVYQGFIEMSRVEPVLHDAATQWIADFVKVYEDDQQLPYPTVRATRLSLPGERAFESYDQALAHITGSKLPVETNLVWEEGMLDVWFEFPIRSDQSKFSISPGLTRLGVRVNVVLRFLPPGGAERIFDVHGDPGIVRLDPRWHQAALRFTADGFHHILDGIDHLLFLFCLVIPFRRLRSLVVVVTSFTLAHSVTLIASAYNLAPDGLWFPPLVETLIAVSIVYMAFENIVGAIGARVDGDIDERALNRRWAVAFGFGLIHGFGFSFALRESLQFAGSHLLTSLLAFNVGVELGQLLVLIVLVPVLNLLFGYTWRVRSWAAPPHRVAREKIVTILLSALIAHTGWHWATERGTQLLAFGWPTLNLALLLSSVRLLMVILVACALAWFIFGVLFRRRARA
jgi:hypothetical protein